MVIVNCQIKLRITITGTRRLLQRYCSTSAQISLLIICLVVYDHILVVNGMFNATPISCTVTLTPLLWSSIDDEHDIFGQQKQQQHQQRQNTAVGAELLAAMYGDHNDDGGVSTSVSSSVWNLPDDDRALVDGADGCRTSTDRDNHATNTHRNCRPSTYLELPVESIFNSPAFALHGNETLTILDLGAGVGKVGATAVLVYCARRGVGVELSPTRFDVGCRAMKRLSYWAKQLDNDRGGTTFQQSSPPTAAPFAKHRNRSILQKLQSFRSQLKDSVEISLLLGDILDYNDFNTTDRVVIFATCFPSQVTETLQIRMAEKLPKDARVFSVGAHANGWSKRVSVEVALLYKHEHNDSNVNGNVTASDVATYEYHNRTLEVLSDMDDALTCHMDNNDIAKHVWVLQEGKNYDSSS